MSCRQRADSNCLPWSVMIVNGAPKRETQPLMKAHATTSAVIDCRGNASGHLVKRSTHVNRYVAVSL